jgi:hypothetical protein
LQWLNLNCASIIGRSFTNFVFFYVDCNSKMTTTAGHSFYIGPIGSFYNQVNDTGSWEPLVFKCHILIALNLQSQTAISTIRQRRVKVSVRVLMGSCFGRVRPKTIKFVFFASLLK